MNLLPVQSSAAHNTPSVAVKLLWQECLGYGKVFVWTQGIDSHGNVNPPPGRRLPDESDASTSVSPTGHQQGQGQHDRAQPQPQPDYSDQHPLARLVQQAQQAAQEAEEMNQQQQQQSRHQQPTPPDSEGSPSRDPSIPWPSPAALTDPLFQDLDRTSRYYLAHFNERVCKDLVVRDTPENPFRELIPLTRKHPLLLQILVATSAIHWSNIFRRVTEIPAGLTNPAGYLSLLRSKDLVTRQALIDALTAKQKAMSHMREVLDTLDPAGSEVALAAMHFFIKFDLIDLDKSDNQSWRAHLEGATSIMALLNPDSNPDASSRMLRDRVITDSFIYNILGSTLTSGGLAARVARQAFQFLPVMKRVELTSYLSCPPEILNIILSASELSHEVPWTDQSLVAADKAIALIDEALAVDIPAWADYLRQHNLVQDLESRVCLAAAHRSAACLYILQALPLVRSVRSIDTDFLLEDVLRNLAAIDENDPYFKASSWPTFVAGAETRDPEKRTWTLARLLSIWQICPWGYLFTAIEMLKATWAMQDSRGSDNVNWLHDLRGMGFENLIV
ncbi:fungal transcriptional regulatory [Fusarium circinatum]|uniref:Fungal transcriptional regulatory n=1 Tax=Fusarium circinatum TaxID=48490 RepID=A0A8H5X5C2_FUSCI|nr:fungal transcriptional regulatory [Fusarium circinatum]